jgi:hypothetical protein
MTVPPLILLIAYGIFFLVFIGLAFANFYNVIRFGFMKGLIITVTFVFVVSFVGVVLGTLVLLQDVDWHQPIEINPPSISLP